MRLAPATPTGEAFAAQMDAALQGEDGMPAFLRQRHQKDIEGLGGEGVPGLGKKCFPKACVSL